MIRSLLSSYFWHLSFNIPVINTSVGPNGQTKGFQSRD